MNPLKTTPKDFFLHLGAIICLFVSAGSLTALLFEIINRSFPDALAYLDLYSSGMRFAIASLIIIFPLLLVLLNLINKEITREPAKADLMIRKWLIYFTLFVAGVAIIVDLVTLINTFLGGEITVRFIFKVIAVLLVAGIIFWYYITDLRRTGGTYRRTAATLSAIIVIASIVSGFVIIGSPAKARAIRFDERKVNDLQSIQSQVINYWIQKNKLPATLNDLKDPISSYMVPTDPQTNKDYVYSVASSTGFRLCADFNEPTPKAGSGRYPSYAYDYIHGMNENWVHERGTKCFDRIIDPELYKRPTRF